MSATAWRMPTKCDTCPFHTTGPGLRLRKTLRRWSQILASIRRGEAFYCHKTTTHDEDGEFVPTRAARYCAGALEYEDTAGVSSNYRRVCERLDHVASRRRQA